MKPMEELNKFIEEMRSTRSATDKIAIISRSSAFIHKILEATYNPYKQYYTTSKTCKKNSDKCYYDGGDLYPFELLDSLSDRKFTGHEAITLVNGWVENNEYGELLYRIIDKNLDIRAGDKVINKAVPGLIPTFSVALAQEYKGKCDWDDNWYASRKLDGVRCLAVTDTEGKCTLYSRMGKEFTTLNKIKYAIEATGVINYVFDGEICLLDEDGNEDFQGVMKELRRKDHQIKNPTFMIFDMIHKTEFDKGKSTDILSERLHTLRTWLGPRYDTKETLRYLDQSVITNETHFNNWNQMASDNNWEGFMLRKDTEYEGKRSKNLLKVKSFYDAEYEVLGFDVDNHEVVRDGNSVSMTMLSQVCIEHIGYLVKVGSGFTQEQRLEYMDGSIVGKVITVQYFEETNNQEGGISLRFPTVKVIHGDKREV
jgi:DNA ligase-1